MPETLYFTTPLNQNSFAILFCKAILIMIDIQQLTSLISAFRVETEKSAIKWVQCQICLNIAKREQIMQYSLWQDYITDYETPRGNSGNLGRAKKRQCRR